MFLQGPICLEGLRADQAPNRLIRIARRCHELPVVVLFTRFRLFDDWLGFWVWLLDRLLRDAGLVDCLLWHRNHVGHVAVHLWIRSGLLLLVPKINHWRNEARIGHCDRGGSRGNVHCHVSTLARWYRLIVASPGSARGALGIV